jgi:hypothetical protein
MAESAQKKTARRAATAAEAAAMQKAEFDARRSAAAGMGSRGGAPMDRSDNTNQFKKGGKTKKMAKGGSASRRADGCATQGKTKGKFV